MIWDKFLSEADRSRLKKTGPAVPAGLGSRPALLVIDVSWSFAGDDPAEDILASIRRWPNSCGAEGWAAIARISALIEVARFSGTPVIYSTGCSRSDGWDLGSWSWKNKRSSEWKPQSAGIDGNEIVSSIAPKVEDTVFYKRKPSIFFGTSAATYLRRMNCDSVILTGTTTSGCVRASAVDAFSHGFQVTVIEDACFDRGEASHAIALFDIAMRYGSVMRSGVAITHLSAHAP